MPKKCADLSGKRYHSLTICSPTRRWGCKSYVECLCDCGAKVTVRLDDLKNGNTKSCGCHRKENMREIAYLANAFNLHKKRKKKPIPA